MTNTPKPLKTLGCHLVELNTALNLQPDKDSLEETELEKVAIKRAVLGYMKNRKECLNMN